MNGLCLQSWYCSTIFRKGTNRRDPFLFQVDHFLQSKLFDRSDAVNADLLDSLAVGVLKVISDAKKAKKPIKAKVVPNDKEISLAQLTAAYLDEGMHCINRVGEKKERRRRGAREPRNRAAFEELARLASEEPTETVDAEEAPETVEPAA